MLKILYAASNNENAKIQLARFISAMKGKPFIIKVAAYKKSSPKGMAIDWTLDCLLNIFNPEHISLDNDNLRTYFDQVKYFSPDLIISDLEYFTSFIANEMNVTLWQCSSSIVNFALTQKYKYDLGVFSKHAYLFNKNPIHTQRIVNIIDNSNCNFVYSHFGDTGLAPPLKENFEWIRPYHSIGKTSVPCQHNIVAGLISNNKKVLNVLKKYSDSVAFTEFQDEKYDNLLLKVIENEEEYFCNLKNSNLFINEGQTSFLADAFYNEKYSIVLPNMEDSECVLNSTISEKLELSRSIYQLEDLDSYMNVSIPIKYDEQIKLLHQKVEEI
jgi:hypothetical protein